MSMPCRHRSHPKTYKPSQGQTAIEYLLLLTVVAVVVIASLSPNLLISNVKNAAENFYNGVTQVIQGQNPTPINGDWCSVACTQALVGQHIFAKCACPAPAFGGAYCGAPAWTSCRPGQQCKAAVVMCGDADTMFPVGQQPPAACESANCPPANSCSTTNVCGFDCCGKPCGRALTPAQRAAGFSDGIGGCYAGYRCTGSANGPGSCTQQITNCQGSCSQCGGPNNNDPALRGLCNYTITLSATPGGQPCTFGNRSWSGCSDAGFPGQTTCTIFNVECGTACTATATTQNGRICNNTVADCCNATSGCWVQYSGVTRSTNGGERCIGIDGTRFDTDIRINCPNNTTCSIGGQANGVCRNGTCQCAGTNDSCSLTRDGGCRSCNTGASCTGNQCQCPGTDQYCRPNGNGGCSACLSGERCVYDTVSTQGCCSTGCPDPAQYDCGTTITENCNQNCSSGSRCSLPNQICENNLMPGATGSQPQCCNNCLAQGNSGNEGSRCSANNPCQGTGCDACGHSCGCNLPYECNPQTFTCQRRGCDGTFDNSAYGCDGVCSITPTRLGCSNGRPVCGARDDGSCTCLLGQSRGCDGICSASPCRICGCDGRCNSGAVRGCDGVCEGGTTGLSIRGYDCENPPICGGNYVWDCQQQNCVAAGSPNSGSACCRPGQTTDACGDCGGRMTANLCMALTPTCTTRTRTGQYATSGGYSCSGDSCTLTYTGRCSCTVAGGCAGTETVTNGVAGPCVSSCSAGQTCYQGSCCTPQNNCNFLTDCDRDIPDGCGGQRHCCGWSSCPCRIG